MDSRNEEGIDLNQNNRVPSQPSTASMSLEGFEVAVVGAGPAGSAAALTLAKQGVQVLLVERGSFPGSKNVFGGIIYSYALKRLLGEH